MEEFEMEFKNEPLDSDLEILIQEPQVLIHEGTDAYIFPPIFLKDEFEIGEEMVTGQSCSEYSVNLPELQGQYVDSKLVFDEGHVNQEFQNTNTSSNNLGATNVPDISKVITVNSKPYMCGICKICFEKPFELGQHMSTHRRKKLMQCPECDFTFSVKSHFQIHALTHSKEMFKCGDCNFQTNREYNLKSHMVSHTKQFKFRCSYCAYQAMYKSHMKTHMLTHTDAKVFKCLDCGYQCKYRYHLKRHLLKHCRAKLFKCSECNYECNKKCNLATHMLIHSKGDISSPGRVAVSKELTTSTEVWGRISAYKIPSNWSELKENKKNVIRYKCNDCDYESLNQSDINKHVLTKHL